jgi:hypothetical protein
MNCEQAAGTDLAARYATSQLSPEERDSYEQHYFECWHCFEEVQLHLSMQAALKTVPRVQAARAGHAARGWAAWVGIAATVIVMASIGSWRLRLPARPPQPAVSSVPVAAPAPPDPIELLARVDPPVYQPPALRGAASDPHFRNGMEQYRQAKYAAANDELSQADPKSPDVQLFLGISYLLQNQPDAAVSHLRATLKLGDSLDLEPAHFYLAKTFLKRRDAAGARAELQAVIALHGDYEKAAREIVEKLPQ